MARCSGSCLDHGFKLGSSHVITIDIALATALAAPMHTCTMAPAGHTMGFGGKHPSIETSYHGYAGMLEYEYTRFSVFIVTRINTRK